jgi:hypothetical protein
MRSNDSAVQIKAEEVMTGEVLKIKAEYATVSAQLLEIDLHGRKQLNEGLRMERSKDGEISEKKITEMMTEWEDVKDQFGVLEKSCRKQMELYGTMNKLEHLAVEYRNEMNQSKAEVMRIESQLKDYEKEIHPIVMEVQDNLKALQEFRNMGIPTAEKVQEIVVQDAMERQACFEKCQAVLNSVTSDATEFNAKTNKLVRRYEIKKELLQKEIQFIKDTQQEPTNEDSIHHLL